MSLSLSTTIIHSSLFDFFPRIATFVMGLLTKPILRGGLPSPILEERSCPMKKQTISFSNEDVTTVNKRRSWPVKNRASSFPIEDVKAVIERLKRGFDEKENNVQKTPQIHCPPPTDQKVPTAKLNKRKTDFAPMAIRELQSHCADAKRGYWDLEDLSKRSRASKQSGRGNLDVSAEIKKSPIQKNQKKTTILAEGRKRRRRCMRCVEQGNDPKQAMKCPGSKSSIGGDGCLYFHADGSRTEPPKAPKKKVSKALPATSIQNTSTLYRQTDKGKDVEDDDSIPTQEEDEFFAKHEFYREAIQAAKDFVASEEGRDYQVEDGVPLVLV